MKKKINIEKRLHLSKDKLTQLSDQQLSSMLGGRMAAATYYTSTGPGRCSENASSCCSEGASSCCG